MPLNTDATVYFCIIDIISGLKMTHKGSNLGSLLHLKYNLVSLYTEGLKSSSELCLFSLELPYLFLPVICKCFSLCFRYYGHV